MKIVPVVLVAIVMLMALSAGVASAKNQSPHVVAQPFPSITLNMTGSEFYNLSYMGMILETPNGTHAASFNQGKWNFTSSDNGSYSYFSTVKFIPDNSQVNFSNAIAFAGNNGNGGKGHNSTGNSTGNGAPTNSTKGQSGNSSRGSSDKPILANVTINMKALNDSLSSMSIVNSSEQSGNYSFPQYSMLEITISVTFQEPVMGPGHLEMIQLIKSSETSNGATGYYFGNIVHSHSNAMKGKSQGVRIPSGSNSTGNNNTSGAFYWWYSSYDLNGVSHNLSSSVDMKDGGVFIMFDFAFNNTTSLKSVYQDPYIGIPGQPVFNNPIVQKVAGEVVNYVLVNSAYFATGLASGIVMLGTFYSAHRRRRF